MINKTLVKEFLLLGFQVDHQSKAVLFILFLILYLLTILGNLLIIVLVYTYRKLQSPMYIFLSNLSLVDILFSTNIVPNMLVITLKERPAICVNECIAQFFFYGMLGGTECFLLTVMSYDRYLAICNPLKYTYIMDFKLQHFLLAVSWVTSATVTLLPSILLHQLYFCGPSVIDHFFCDLDPILNLSCSDTGIVKTETLISTIFVVIIPFLVVISSYARILITILGISSTESRQKTFSTCSTHLLVVCTYFLTIITVYSNPSKTYSSNAQKVRSLLYTVLTPLFNPVIYALRNNEIKTALHKLLTQFNSNMYCHNKTPNKMK
ncbi:olfactory receptor 10A7-like [Pseudophryne corroboree]|uniref:olfactory receptor 10A7-like n=1 Tax=Pseudophryne corroboree TaxID=495146 RepID=UPI003081353F